VSGRIWEAVETSSGEIGMGKAEGGESKGRSRKETRGENRKKKQKKGKIMEVKKVAEEWEIWDKEEEAAKLEAEAKKLVPEKFHKWIKVFRKKQSKRMLMRKV